VPPQGSTLVTGAIKSSPQRRYPANSSNPGLWNCNLLDCICVLFSTDRRWSSQVIKKALGDAGKTYAANAGGIGRANVAVVADGEAKQ